MGWSGRAPAPPASEAGKGRQRQGARHVSDTQYRDRRDRQELVPRRGPRCARCHRAAAKSAARPYTALPDRHGSLRRGTSPEPQSSAAELNRQLNHELALPPIGAEIAAAAKTGGVSAIRDRAKRAWLGHGTSQLSELFLAP